MTSTPVGMRCPECARQRTRVHRAPAGLAAGAAPVTMAFIGLCVAAFVAQIAGGADLLDGSPLGTVTLDFGLLGFGATDAAGLNLIGVGEGEYYRIITGGLLHGGVLHLGLNMLALYFLGSLLEAGIGSWRFAGVLVVSLIGGSLGALIISPDQLTVGASGAVFGLMAAAFLEARDRGRDDLASQIGFYVVINLVITFSFPQIISIGGHVGGLLAGGVLTLVLAQARRSARGKSRPLEIGVIVAVGAALLVACVIAGDASVPAGV